MKLLFTLLLTALFSSNSFAQQATNRNNQLIQDSTSGTNFNSSTNTYSSNTNARSCSPITTTENYSGSCSSGYTGSINYQRTVTNNCGVLSYGGWIAVSNSCTLAAPPPTYKYCLIHPSSGDPLIYNPSGTVMSSGQTCNTHSDCPSMIYYSGVISGVTVTYGYPTLGCH